MKAKVFVLPIAMLLLFLLSSFNKLNFQPPDIMKRIAFLLQIVPAVLIISGQAGAQQEAHHATLNYGVEMNYLLYLPENYTSDSTVRFPLLLFLHGGGEGGYDIEKVKRNGPPKLVEDGHSFPFIILSPQNADSNNLWDTRAVKVLLDKIVGTHRVDTTRIYLTGLSRGGFGAWMTAIQNPDRFAALIPVCGVAPAFYGKWLGQMPIWMFHGADDPVIPVSESDEMAEVLRKNGNPVKYIRYPETGHDAWTRTYENPEVFEWMLQQRLGQGEGDER
jgi:predicted peptidase